MGVSSYLLRRSRRYNLVPEGEPFHGIVPVDTAGSKLVLPPQESHVDLSFGERGAARRGLQAVISNPAARRYGLVPRRPSVPSSNPQATMVLWIPGEPPLHPLPPLQSLHKELAPRL